MIRRWRNKIEALLDDQGSWIWDPANLRSLVVSFFTDLFAEENFNRNSFPIKGLFPLLHDSEKTVLLKDVHRKEITSAPFDMGAHKSPGLDGFQAHFFQSQWRTEGVGVYQFVQGIFWASKIFHGLYMCGEGGGTLRKMDSWALSPVHYLTLGHP